MLYLYIYWVLCEHRQGVISGGGIYTLMGGAAGTGRGGDGRRRSCWCEARNCYFTISTLVEMVKYTNNYEFICTLPTEFEVYDILVNIFTNISYIL